MRKSLNIPRFQWCDDWSALWLSTNKSSLILVLGQDLQQRCWSIHKVFKGHLNTRWEPQNHAEDRLLRVPQRWQRLRARPTQSGIISSSGVVLLSAGRQTRTRSKRWRQLVCRTISKEQRDLRRPLHWEKPNMAERSGGGEAGDDLRWPFGMTWAKSWNVLKEEHHMNDP